MDAKTKAQLEQAKAYCYEWRLQEAYGIFRRFFDRLPFQPEKEHAEHIGMYVRILLELGKDYELKFYGAELERLYADSGDPALGYQLGTVYLHASEPRDKATTRLFRSVIESEASEDLKTKSKICLVLLHARQGDLTQCRQILETIPEPIADLSLSCVARTWRAIIERREGRLEEAETWIAGVLRDCSFERDWYSYVSARIEEARIAHQRKQAARVAGILKDLRRLLAKRRCKTMQCQVDHLEKSLAREVEFGTIHLSSVDDERVVSYRDRTLTLNRQTVLDRLALLLLKRRTLTKKCIVEKLYARGYDASCDDRRIHYQIHSLRKRLGRIGVPPEAIRCRGNGYRLLAKVEISGEEI